MIVANILIDEDWRTTIGGEEYVFPPFAQFRVSVEDGNYLLEKAITAHTDKIEQARGERNMWARKISSLSQRERDQALRFCDKDGNPITKPWPYCPLVNLSSSSGQEAFQKALAAAKERGIKPDFIKTKERGLDIGMDYVPDPDAGNIMESRSEERSAYEPNEVVPPRANPPATTRAQVEQPEPPQDGGDRIPVRIKKPHEGMSNEDLAKYAKQQGFTVTKIDEKVPGRLLEIAQKAYVENTKRLTAGGVEYVEE